MSPSALLGLRFQNDPRFTGSHYIFKLNQRARERGVRFLYEQPVTDLLQDPVSGNVNGVVVKSKNHEVIYIAAMPWLLQRRIFGKQRFMPQIQS